MPIAPSDIEFRLSGGAANANPDTSLGGVMSSVAMPTTANGLFTAFSGAETAAGRTEYRLVYLRNNHGTLPLRNAKVFLSANTSNPATDVAFGFATEGANANAAAVTDEITAPAGVTFAAPATFATGTALPPVFAPTDRIGVWMRFTSGAQAAASASSANAWQIDVQGDTDA